MKTNQNEIKKEAYVENCCSGNPYVKKKEKNSPNNFIWMGKKVNNDEGHRNNC